jgi:hypothetical protein
MVGMKMQVALIAVPGMATSSRKSNDAPRIQRLSGFALDVDRPADLRALTCAMMPGRRARKVLAFPGSALSFDAARDTTDLSIGS